MRAWIDQDPKQRKKLGAKAPWRARWYQDGRQCSKTIGSRSRALKYARRIEGQLAAGLLTGVSRKAWRDFRKEYETYLKARTALRTQEEALRALSHFERVIAPTLVGAVTSRQIDRYVAKRRTEPGRRGSVSPATINKDLRHLRAALRRARAWKYLQEVPEIQFLREFERLPRYMSATDFVALYKVCNPWWRALLMFIQLTGWRIEQTLALRWEDVRDGYAWVAAGDTKGKREFRVPLHPVILQHLAHLERSWPVVFFWPHCRRHLWRVFERLQEAAGLAERYGFHDIRRSFATENAGILGPDLTQEMMQHRSYQTTKLYINLAKRLDGVVSKLFVPKVNDGEKERSRLEDVSELREVDPCEEP